MTWGVRNTSTCSKGCPDAHLHKLHKLAWGWQTGRRCQSFNGVHPPNLQRRRGTAAHARCCRPGAPSNLCRHATSTLLAVTRPPTSLAAVARPSMSLAAVARPSTSLAGAQPAMALLRTDWCTTAWPVIAQLQVTLAATCNLGPARLHHLCSAQPTASRPPWLRQC
jgi:hypothetical protein